MPEKRQIYVSKSSRRGVILLLGLLLLIVFVPRMLIGLFPASPSDLSSEEIQIAKELESKSQFHSRQRTNRKSKRHYKVPERAFDPNTYKLEDWMKLGLSEKQANVVVKFAGRGIRDLNDFNRIAVIPEELKSLIIDSLIFPVKVDKNVDKKRVEPKMGPVVELNLATLEELVELPGIGEYTAEKIIKYRDRLGGFIRREQLMEVSRINPDLFTKLEKSIKVDPSKIKGININTADHKQLKAHPYLNYHIANSIVKMRQQRGGSFKTIEDLLDSELIDRELFEKLKPYLTL